MDERVEIAVARPVPGPFTYRVPPALSGRLVPGQRVRVPFGRGQALGFYLGPSNDQKTPPARLKSVLATLEARPALSEDVLALARFAAEHYRYPLGEVLKTALPPGLSGGEEEQVVPPEAETFIRATDQGRTAQLKRSPVQTAVMSYLLAVGGSASLEELALGVAGAREALRRLEEKGLVVSEAREIVPGVVAGLGQGRPEHLTADQRVAIDAIEGALAAASFQTFLLHGVTGSGKTEVYLQCAEGVLARGKGALVLVPEIALTPQLVGRFRSRFGSSVAVLHSGLKDSERLRHWQNLREGSVRIAVGVRSAVFAPVQNLALIVVDEEHDPSFKQEDKLKYQARDLAVMRAKQLGAVAVLGSATPSLESLENARRERYQLVTLPTRVQDRPLPRIELVDLRRERPRSDSILSAPLLVAMEETLTRHQQVILFLNRRGHSTCLLCSQCGTPLKCDQCDVTLTHHLSLRRVMCHYCGSSRPPPTACAECGGELLQLGAGTERVELELAARFPRARVARLDRDATGTSEKLTQTLASFARRELDVLVGTQMVAKGHDFPGVTLVCVVLADTALSLPDFRAAERTFQLLTQVSGRAGRGSEPGRVLIQTYNPEAECIARVVAHDYAGFADHELAWRKALAYPPFARLAGIRVEGDSEIATARAARELSENLVSHLPAPTAGVRLLGPAVAPLAKLRGKTRWQLLLKAPGYAPLTPLLERAEARAEDFPPGVRAIIDVDPWAML